MRKRAQMEIMGLVVIILLLSLGMLFTVNYMIKRQPSEAKKDYTESQMAANILSAILKTSTPMDESDPLYCYKVDFTELLQDCSRPFPIIYCEGIGLSSCDYAQNNIKKMLDDTLGQWNRPYRFKAWRVNDDKELFEPIVGLECDDNNIGPGKKYIQRKTKLSPIPLNPGTLMVQFDICS
jgi:hypothetical protein